MFDQNARSAASKAIALAVADYPFLLPEAWTAEELTDGRERQLAIAIHRTVVQRWITLEALLNTFLRKPLEHMEPSMAGVLLTGAAQLLFFDRLPVYAVINEMVGIASRQVRSGAKGLVNAVLRRVADAVEVVDEPWTAAPRTLPREGGYLQVKEGFLPNPAKDLPAYLAVATSHPCELVEHWLSWMPAKEVIALCQHSLQSAPTILSCDEILDESMAVPHETPGFAVWRGDYGQLQQTLASHRFWRVQDPTAARAMTVCEDLDLKVIVDFCAGKGTKSLQLAQAHSQAQVYAADPDARRFAMLKDVAEQVDNLHAVPASDLPTEADLLVLDVPCTNTGVLARRPEARYRFSRESHDELVALQRRIIKASLKQVTHAKYLLYSTCSLCPSENGRMAQWALGRYGGSLLREYQTYPGGTGNTYHDGGYVSLIDLSL